jgi:adenosylhomocysteine nucleosidase
MKSLTVIPIQAEFDFFVQACAGQGLAIERSTLGRLPVTYLPGLGLTLAQGGLGKAQFAVQTQHLIDSGKDWAVVICAGALDDRLAVGDVVIGTQTIEYDIHNKFGKPLLPQFDGAGSVVEDFRRMKLEGVSFKTHFGAIASGDEDIVDVGRRREVRDLTGAWPTRGKGQAERGRAVSARCRLSRFAAYPTGPTRRRPRTLRRICP